MAALELFHAIADPDSAAARRKLGELALFERVAMRNVSFDSHRAAFEAHGGTRLPALWDGARLHQGRDAVLAALEAVPH